MKSNILKGLSFLFALGISSDVFSQGSPPPPPCWPPPCSVPVNSGIIVLVIAGFVYGIYILYKKKNIFS